MAVEMAVLKVCMMVVQLARPLVEQRVVLSGFLLAGLLVDSMEELTVVLLADEWVAQKAAQWESM